MMKRKFATIMVATLFALSLSACGSSSEGSIIETEEAADEANEVVESEPETQTTEGTEDAQPETAPAEGTEEAQGGTTEAAPEAAPEEGTQDAAAATGASGEVEGGANQAQAVLIALDQQVMSTNESSSWYSFTTSSNPDSVYQISIINMSGDGSLCVSLKDLFGDQLAFTYGDADGSASSCSSDELDVDTTYYIEVTNYRGGPLDFALAVRETTDD